jgi:hypothetical protein
MRYRKSAALFAILLPALLLSGCATTAQISPPTAMTATQADRTATLALRAAREARQKEAAIRAQKAQAAQAFCSRWQRGLGRARRNLMGCAQMPTREQPFCWDAVSQWSADEGTAFTRLSVVLSNTPFYAASRQAATFFSLSRPWISACRKDHESCAVAPQVTRMQSLKAQVNARCQTLPLR